LSSPLNYGDDDLEGLDELNGDRQAAVAVRGDLSREGLCSRLSGVESRSFLVEAA